MLANTSDTIFKTLLPENSTYGFAIAHLIESQFDHCCCSVHNQQQEKNFDASRPQAIEYWGQSLDYLKVPDFYDWHIKVFIDSTQDFYKQKVQLIRACEPINCCGELTINFEARDLSLRALLHLFDFNKSSWPMLFECFEVDQEASNEYFFTADEVIAEELP